MPPARRYDWARVEQRLGLVVPADYRRLIDVGGAGVWFDYFQLIVPDGRHPDEDLAESGALFEDLKVMWDSPYMVPPDDCPKGGRLIAWATTVVGHTIYWLVAPEAAEGNYPVYVSSIDVDTWRRYDLSATDFLLLQMQRAPESDLFQDSWFGYQDAFVPYPSRDNGADG